MPVDMAPFITERLLRQIAPTFHGHKHISQLDIIRRISHTIGAVTIQYGISTVLRQAHFIAQICHESDGFCTLHEYASGKEYEGRIKGLGNTQPGDGARFKGRGLIQLTGRANYHVFGALLALPLEENPELACDAAVAVQLACSFWQQNHINPFCDLDDIVHVTRRVNGGLNGLDQRKRLLLRAKAALGIPVFGPPKTGRMLAASQSSSGWRGLPAQSVP